ncbi:MAG: heavy metal-binding domain-containing protein [Bacteroidota bacterium]
MKYILIVACTFFMFVLADRTFAQEKKGKSCGDGCCENKTMAMAEMQSHKHQKHDQHAKDTTAKKDKQSTAVEYTCPMHPEVRSDKPGTCPKCKMDLVEVKKEKKSLLKQKMEAMAIGKYNCCIEEPCDECLKAHGSCSCKKAVKDGKPVCDECYKGWQNGEGTVSGKTLNDIKKGHQHNH